MSDIQLQGVDIEVYVRLNILSMAIAEYLEAFGASESTIKTVEKGVYKRQLIKEIYLYYYNDKKEIVGEISFYIDWEKYKVNMGDEKGNKFELCVGKSILEQLDESSNEIIKHVNKIRKDLSVQKVKTTYVYIDECYANEKILNETREYLGTNKGDSTRSIRKVDMQFTQTVDYIMGALNELELTIKNM